MSQHPSVTLRAESLVKRYGSRTVVDHALLLFGAERLTVPIQA